MAFAREWSLRAQWAAAFLTGLATAYTWAVTLNGPSGGLFSCAWVAIGSVASLGAARVAARLLSGSKARRSSVSSTTAAYLLGGAVGMLLPPRWLEVLDYAGAILLLLLILGLLTGVAEVAQRIVDRHRGSRGI